MKNQKVTKTLLFLLSTQIALLSAPTLAVKRHKGIRFTQEEKNTLLYFVIDSGNIDIIRKLLNHDADPNEMDKNGDTSLSLAIDQEDPDIVRELLNYGADINHTNKKGVTPLALANSKYGSCFNSAILTILNKHKAVLDAAKIDNKTDLPRSATPPQSLTTSNQNSSPKHKKKKVSKKKKKGILLKEKNFDFIDQPTSTIGESSSSHVGCSSSSRTYSPKGFLPGDDRSHSPNSYCG